MTEVMSETPMKIQEEENKVENAFEHLIKEWMAFQGLEDILQILGSLFRDPDGTINKYDHTSTQRGNKHFPLACGIQPFPALSLG